MVSSYDTSMSHSRMTTQQVVVPSSSCCTRASYNQPPQDPGGLTSCMPIAPRICKETKLRNSARMLSLKPWHTCTARGRLLGREWSRMSRMKARERDRGIDESSVWGSYLRHQRLSAINLICRISPVSQHNDALAESSDRGH